MVLEKSLYFRKFSFTRSLHTAKSLAFVDLLNLSRASVAIIPSVPCMPWSFRDQSIFDYPSSCSLLIVKSEWYVVLEGHNAHYLLSFSSLPCHLHVVNDHIDGDKNFETPIHQSNFFDPLNFNESWFHCTWYMMKGKLMPTTTCLCTQNNTKIHQ